MQRCSAVQSSSFLAPSWTIPGSFCAIAWWLLRVSVVVMQRCGAGPSVRLEDWSAPTCQRPWRHGALRSSAARMPSGALSFPARVRFLPCMGANALSTLSYWGSFCRHLRQGDAIRCSFPSLHGFERSLRFVLLPNCLSSLAARRL